MDRHPLMFFGLYGSHDLAGMVARRMDMQLATHEEREFEDGEHKSRPLADVRGRCLRPALSVW